MVQILFAACMFALVVIGFYCAAKMTHQNPFWVRIVVLTPALTAMATLAAMFQGSYIAYSPDIFRAISVMLLYMLVASRFSSTPWLDLRVDKCN